MASNMRWGQGEGAVGKGLFEEVTCKLRSGRRDDEAGSLSLSIGDIWSQIIHVMGTVLCVVRCGAASLAPTH